MVKWRGLGYEEATRERWSDVLDACGDKDALDAQVAQCAARFSNSSAKPQAKARMAKDKTSVKSTKHAVPLAPYRGGPLQLRPYQIDGVAWLAYSKGRADPLARWSFWPSRQDGTLKSVQLDARMSRKYGPIDRVGALAQV